MYVCVCGIERVEGRRRAGGAREGGWEEGRGQWWGVCVGERL